MNTLLVIEFCISVLFLCEAILEKYVISLKNPALTNYHYLDNKEHAWSLIYSVLLCAVVGIVSKEIWIIPSLLASRRLCFDYPLKFMRGKPFREIQGNGWFDKNSRSVFGIKGGYKEAFTIVLFKMLYLTFSLL